MIDRCGEILLSEEALISPTGPHENRSPVPIRPELQFITVIQVAIKWTPVKIEL